jgi:2-phosphosulfolactate phosphatase
LLLCTTNGTRALLAARSAAVVLVGALVNASAVAARIAASGRDAVMVCAGTGGAVAMEDVLGAGAVIEALMVRTTVHCQTDVARMALELFRACRSRLEESLRGTRGGMNVIQAGLSKDIEFAASIDSLQVVGIAAGQPLVVRGA